jgi:hypothetical protein
MCNGKRKACCSSKSRSEFGKYLTTVNGPLSKAARQAAVLELPKIARVDTPQSPKTTVEIRNEVAMRQDVFSLAEVQVTIQWPSTLSKESFEDTADWLKILERKIGRSVSEEPKQ